MTETPCLTIEEINRAFSEGMGIVKPGTLVFHAVARMNELYQIVKEQSKLLESYKEK